MESSASIADVKDLVAEKEGIPAHQQRLVFAGQLLEDNRTLADYNVREGSTFHLILADARRPAPRRGASMPLFVKTMTGMSMT